MKYFIPDANIEDLPIFYTAVAADIINKEEVAFTRGSVFEAIRASMAIPTVFTPVKTETGLLVDGGVLNNIPVNHALRRPDDLLVVVNVNADIPVERPKSSKRELEKKQSVYQKKIREFYGQLQKINPLSSPGESIGYFNLITKTLSLMTYHMSQMALERYSPDILINISRDSCGTYDFFKAEELVAIGRLAAKKSLGNYYNSLKDR
jgi:NTE family protein